MWFHIQCPIDFTLPLHGFCNNTAKGNYVVTGLVLCQALVHCLADWFTPECRHYSDTATSRLLSQARLLPYKLHNTVQHRVAKYKAQSVYVEIAKIVNEGEDQSPRIDQLTPVIN